MTVSQDVNDTPGGLAGQVRSVVLGVRLTPEELRAVRIAAARRDQRPSEYIRDVLLPQALAEAA